MTSNTRICIIAWGILGTLAAQVFGLEPAITSFQGNGEMSWTTEVNTSALFRVEWASQSSGPWYRTFDNIGTLDGLTATNFTVSVPIFYRIIMTTNPPPKGMVWIEGGDVELGQVGIGVATPVHTNFVTGFWMDENEVTFGKWKEVYSWAITNGYAFDNAGAGKTNNHPVHTVTWYDCAKWCNARSQKEGLTPCYYTSSSFSNLYKTGVLDVSSNWVLWSSGGYRLPTEAEWEKAARGGRQQQYFPWGGFVIQHADANYFAATNIFSFDISPTSGFHPDYLTGNEPYTSPVGCFPGNGYGLHDMAGNVEEWCWDWLSYNYTNSYDIDPRGPSSSFTKVLRGGSWNTTATALRCAYRDDSFVHSASFPVNAIGFRCARSQ